MKAVQVPAGEVLSGRLIALNQAKDRSLDSDWGFSVPRNMSWVWIP